MAAALTPGISTESGPPRPGPCTPGTGRCEVRAGMASTCRRLPAGLWVARVWVWWAWGLRLRPGVRLRLARCPRSVLRSAASSRGPTGSVRGFPQVPACSARPSPDRFPVRSTRPRQIRHPSALPAPRATRPDPLSGGGVIPPCPNPRRIPPDSRWLACPGCRRAVFAVGVAWTRVRTGLQAPSAVPHEAGTSPAGCRRKTVSQRHNCVRAVVVNSFTTPRP